MWSRVADVRRHAHPDAVEAEWRAQVERALAAGLDVTHVDAHMGAALAPEWCDRYVAARHRVRRAGVDHRDARRLRPEQASRRYDRGGLRRVRRARLAPPACPCSTWCWRPTSVDARGAPVDYAGDADHGRRQPRGRAGLRRLPPVPSRAGRGRAHRREGQPRADRRVRDLRRSGPGRTGCPTNRSR